MRNQMNPGVPPNASAGKYALIAEIPDEVLRGTLGNHLICCQLPLLDVLIYESCIVLAIYMHFL